MLTPQQRRVATRRAIRWRRRFRAMFREAPVINGQALDMDTIAVGLGDLSSTVRRRHHHRAEEMELRSQLRRP